MASVVEGTSSSTAPSMYQRVQDIKDKGNTWFQEEKFEEAIAAYESAISLASQHVQDAGISSSTVEQKSDAVVTPMAMATLFSNISACRLKLGNTDCAVVDADAAIRLAPKWAKGYFRRAMALVEAERWPEARDAIAKARVLEPMSDELKRMQITVNDAMRAEQKKQTSDAQAQNPNMAVLVRDHLELSAVELSPTVRSSLTIFHPPILQALGLPIVIAYAPKSKRNGDNQLATYFMIHPRSGFAPPQWHNGKVGDIVVLRTDDKPITTKEVYALWDYFSGILDAFGDGEPPVVNRDHLVEWQTSYNDMAVQCGTSDENLREVHFV
jgi:tetratricopeptide (TPR) repeat protein